MGLGILAIFILLTYCVSRPSDAPPEPTTTPTPDISPTRPTSPAPTAPSPEPTASPEVVAPPTPSEAEETVLVQHTVQAGETLLGLAMTYDVPMAAIQRQNGMGTGTVVQAGQVLAIPGPEGWEGASPFWVLHVVQGGETLAGIAARHDLSVAEIQTVNGLTDAGMIRVGQQLILPLGGPAATQPPPTSTPAPPTPTSAPTPTDVPEPTAAAPTFAPGSAASPPADVAAWPREVVRIINQVRAAHGLYALTYNETLAVAAQGHANDCSQRGWCSHTGSDGSDPRARIIRAGYTPASWAECWAMSLSPQHAVDMWMDEVPPNDPHRRTLLSVYQTEIGVGVADAGGWGYYYFIADFGRP
jgi:uncharacterized protein YkwD